ncbi:hypothetical protein AWJ20_2490 [Sugiyamaella lignohabitans]|uniref:Myosin N-terminal SH3-like domain-containing protein n=1 Tax=Sugiyamaella lignohabitans TaxID=796027 RepID=A0A161HMF6_9ASCO|nr:uncharacterized protein AWJ20_2490 [Sugiyamaella lignohabitans]ANB14877.1 hypothetical protein AWJ20_2490 [Sugiyamaella lignohabitans]
MTVRSPASSKVSTPKRVADQTHTFSPSSIVPSISQILRAKNGESQHGTIDIASDSTVQDAEFASKKWVWVPDETLGFIKGFIVSESDNGNTLHVRCTDDSVSIVVNLFKPMRKLTDQSRTGLSNTMK